MKIQANWQAVVAFILWAFALAGGHWVENQGVFETLLPVLFIFLSILASLVKKPFEIPLSIASSVFSLLAVFFLFNMLPRDSAGTANLHFFAALAACWLMGWRLVTVLSQKRFDANKLVSLAIPTLFGMWILILWEAYVRGAGVSFVILPPPSAIGAKFAVSIPILMADAYQTVFKAVLFGFFAGSFAGFLVAVLADRYTFLGQGLLPIGNMVSALPIIGIAPIMVIWFGFDWQSKAAVVIVMTFFPMLVNTLAGLAASGNMERDLM
ncbi:MAG: ABC transporter permease, partial [Rhizobiaceae bacterium]